MPLLSSSLLPDDADEEDQDIPELPLDVSDDDGICFFKKQNYKIEVSVGRSSKLMLTLKAILDTGAGPNLISAHRVPASWAPYVKPVKLPRLVSASKQSLSVIGFIQLVTRIGELKVRIPFLVVTKLVTDMILGTSFLDRYVKAIIPGNRKVLLKGAPSISIVGYTRSKTGATESNDGRPLFDTTSLPRQTVSQKVRLAEKVTVPPMTQITARAQSEVSGMRFLQSHPKLFHRNMTLMANGVMDILPNRPFSVTLSNFSDKTVTIPKNAVVALALPAPLGIVTLEMGDPTKKKTELRKTDLGSWESDVHIGVENEQVREDVLSLLSEYRRMWSGELGKIVATKHRIELQPDAKPVYQTPYRAGHKSREFQQKEVDRMLTDKVIEAAQSEWASPVVLVPKKDGSLRFCVDYRRLNAVTIRDSYPIPRMDECIDSLGDATVFTTLDCNSGYWQIEVAEEDRDKTTFVSHCGMYRFLRMPFGLKNAPATFQRAVDIILSRVKWRFALVYLDDVIIYSKTVEDHFRHVREVLSMLSVAGITLKLRKCNFFDTEIAYLGHTIRPGRLEINNKNTDALRNAQPPTNLTELRSFLGMCNVYRRFVPGFARVAAPLSRKTRKGEPTEWETLTDEELNHLKPCDKNSSPPLSWLCPEVAIVTPSIRTHATIK